MITIKNKPINAWAIKISKNNRSKILCEYIFASQIMAFGVANVMWEDGSKKLWKDGLVEIVKVSISEIETVEPVHVAG